MSGFVLIHRCLIGNPQFRGKDDEYAAMWLILHAAWEACVIRPQHARNSANLERGQCAYAVSYLSSAWECSKATAHARLRHFEKMGFIRTEARTDFTLITICKYSEYQGCSNVDRTQNRTPTERRPNADRTNNKEGKEYKNNIPSSLRSDESPDGTLETQDEDLKARIFGPALQWLSDRSGKPVTKLRSLVGKWCSQNGDGATLEAFQQAARASPVDPISWIEERLNGGKNGKAAETKPTGSDERVAEVAARLRRLKIGTYSDGDDQPVLPSV